MRGLTLLSRVREKDAVLGIATVKLSELFTTSSEVTRLFSLQEGVGEYMPVCLRPTGI